MIPHYLAVATLVLSLLAQNSAYGLSTSTTTGTTGIHGIANGSGNDSNLGMTNAASLNSPAEALTEGEEEFLSYTPPVEQKDVCIIGGGPVGLATAITLSSSPHNYNCVVIEANKDVNEFNPSKGFLYNVNTRGRKFTKKYPEVDEKLQELGVESSFKNFCRIPSGADEALPQIAIDAMKELERENENNKEHEHANEDEDANGDENQNTSVSDKMNEQESSAKVNAGIKLIMDNTQKKGGGNTAAYWIPRHGLTKLLRDYCLDQANGNGNSGSVQIVSGAKCIDLNPSNPETGMGGVEVLVEDITTGELTKYCSNLVVGADGYRSKVRDFLSSNDNENEFKQSNLWEKVPKGKFLVKKFKSAATGLRLKVLQFPPQFQIPNNDDTQVKTNGSYIYSLFGVNKGPRNFIRFGILPSKDNTVVRPVNVIARPNHDVWKINDPDELREWFQKAFPRMNFSKENGILPKEEWERFINEDGTRFPHCQYTNGVALHSIDKKSAIVLVGDALHSYPPDIGQGVNSGLADVVALGTALEDVNLSKEKQDSSKPNLLGDAMKKFEDERLQETKSLIRLARFGSPYQYNQSLRIDVLGKKLWTLNILIRVILNKISFGIIPKPAIMLSQDPNLSFRQVMRRADLLTFGLETCISAILIKIFWKRLLKAVAMT